MKNFFSDKIGKPVYNFINSGGWISCIVLGILGILMASMGMFSTLASLYRSGDHITLVFVGIIDFIVLAVLIFSSIAIVKLIKNNKDIFKY